MTKDCILSGLTRKGCYQKEVSGFLEALHILRKNWNEGNYIVNSWLYTPRFAHIDIDDYLFHHVTVIIEEPDYVDDLPF